MCVRSTLSSAHLSARPPSLSKPHLPPLQASLLQKVSPALAARTLRVSRTAALAAASALRPAQSLSPAGDPPPPRPPHTPHAARRPMLALPLPPSRSWAPLGEEGESAASPWCSYHPASPQAGSRCTTAWKHLPRVRDGCTGLSGPGPACCAEPRAAPVSPDSSPLPGRNPPVCNVGTRARGGVGVGWGGGVQERERLTLSMCKRWNWGASGDSEAGGCAGKSGTGPLNVGASATPLGVCCRI